MTTIPELVKFLNHFCVDATYAIFTRNEYLLNDYQMSEDL